MTKDKINSIISNYRELIKVFPGNVYLKDKKGIILACSEEQARSVGFSCAEEMIGKTAYDTMPKEQAEKISAADREVIEKEEYLVFEEETLRHDGEIGFYLSHKIPLKVDGNELVGILGVSFDITERKKAEEERLLKEKLANQSQVKSKFLYTLQHELRNTLSAIQVCCDIFLSKGAQFVGNKALFEWLQLIDQAMAKTIQTLDRINHYSSLEDGTLKPYPQKFDLKLLLKKLQRSHEKELLDKAIQVHFSMDDTMPDFLVGDIQLIYDITQNLFLNAIKYSKKGGRINLMVKQVGKQKNRYAFDILVEDKGQGILPTVKATLFDMFKPKKAGAEDYETIPGINLSISREMALILGGDLEVHSAVGKGSTFTLSLELEGFNERPTEAQIKSRARFDAGYLPFSIEEPTPKKEHITILVVEDNPYNTYSLKEILSTYVNATLLFASDFESAQDSVLNDLTIDLVFTDIGLPDEEGFKIMECFKEVYPAEETYPYVVAITAYARDVDIEHFLEKGIIEVIPKPISLKPVLEIIQRLFGEQVIKKPD